MKSTALPDLHSMDRSLFDNPETELMATIQQRNISIAKHL
jgi:hypothetical protein